MLDPYSRKTTRGFAWNQGLALGRVHTWSDWLEEAFRTELASLVTNSGPGGDDDQTRRVPGDRDLARAGERVVPHWPVSTKRTRLHSRNFWSARGPL